MRTDVCHAMSVSSIVCFLVQRAGYLGNYRNYAVEGFEEALPPLKE
jgi:hypothetical protein